jgi:hypothetical protein
MYTVKEEEEEGDALWNVDTLSGVDNIYCKNGTKSRASAHK